MDEVWKRSVFSALHFKNNIYKRVTSCTAAIQITHTSFAGLQACKSVLRNLWVQGGRHVLIFGLVSSVKQARPKHWKMSGFLHAGCLRTNWIIGHYFVHTCRRHCVSPGVEWGIHTQILRWGSHRGFHEILLYPMTYRNVRWQQFLKK